MSLHSSHDSERRFRWSGDAPAWAAVFGPCAALLLVTYILSDRKPNVPSGSQLTGKVNREKVTRRIVGDAADQNARPTESPSAEPDNKWVTHQQRVFSRDGKTIWQMSQPGSASYGAQTEIPWPGDPRRTEHIMLLPGTVGPRCDKPGKWWPADFGPYEPDRAGKPQHHDPQ